jgi:hypothetical protein
VSLDEVKVATRLVGHRIWCGTGKPYAQLHQRLSQRHQMRHPTLAVIPDQSCILDAASIQSAHLCDVLNNEHLELVSVRCERLLQVLRLLSTSYGAANGVAGLEQLIDDVECNAAVRAGDGDLGSCVGGEGGHNGRWLMVLRLL